jgi:hypothetical protein
MCLMCLPHQSFDIGCHRICIGRHVSSLRVVTWKVQSWQPVYYTNAGLLATASNPALQALSACTSTAWHVGAAAFPRHRGITAHLATSLDLLQYHAVELGGQATAGH